MWRSLTRWLTAFALLSAGSACATEKPLWELGAGVATGSFPSYRGATSQQSYALPFPFIVYRGEKVTLDRKGMRGELFESKRWRLELSADAMTPVESDDGPREGMPDLAPMLEIGPSLEYLLDDRGGTEWRLRLPLRSAIAFAPSGVTHEGWLFHPNIALDAHSSGWEVGGSLGPLFATRRYHDYYYGVSPAEATATRQAYTPDGGYSGLRITVAASRYFGSIWLGGFLRYDDLHGAAFIDSPLVEQEGALMGGIAIAWVFRRSSTLVPR